MLSFQDFIRVTHGYPHHLSMTQTPAGISIDSRTLQPGDLFVAIRGKNFDGHHFLNEAIKKGACGCVVDKTFFQNSPSAIRFPCIEVIDTDVALRQMANAWRLRFQIPTVAITGSCGKTTTKEMTKAILETRFKLLSSQGNFNNQYGLPLTLFRLNESYQAILAEIGANHRGEIKTLCETLEPQLGLITNVGLAHIEGFGGLDGVYRAKLELGEFLAAHGGTLVVGGDDPKLVARAHDLDVKLITFGTQKSCDFYITEVKSDAQGLKFQIQTQERFFIQTQARFNVPNALGAIVIAKQLGLPSDEIQAGLDHFQAPGGRFEIKTLQNTTFVFDAYNANPTSFKASLEAFFSLPASGRRWVVCGDMLELGEESAYWHRQVGERLADFPLFGIVTVGSQAQLLAEACIKKNSGILAHFCKDNKEVAEVLKHQLKEGDSVFLKGSRGMKLEQVLDAFTENSRV